MNEPASARPGPLHVVVATVVHHPMDARIMRRQIGAMLQDGVQVTYLAPWADTRTGVPRELAGRGPGRVHGVDVPRSVGRDRARALRRARRRLAELAPSADVILVHDPELVPVLPRVARRPATRPGPALVWDVHEDTAAALAMKPWLPRPLRPLAAAGVAALERAAAHRVHLLLAEDRYVDRLGSHPVVPNLPVVPETVSPVGADRVVYVGMITPARGVHELVRLGQLLRGDGISVELVGEPAGPGVRDLLEAADRDGDVRWHGRLPNEQALALTDGALAGLSLLHDQPNYRHSLPTKVAEYLAHGVPVVTTPLPLAAEMVRAADGGVVVPFGDVQAVAQAVADQVRAMAADPALRAGYGARGHAWARTHADWTPHARRLVGQLQAWADQRHDRRPGT